MVQNPSDAKYTKEHEWIIVKGFEGTVGITDFAQSSLTDIVFVELAEVGKTVDAMKSAAIVESVKSVSDVFSPVSGKIIEANSELSKNPQLVNQDPYGRGWIFKIKLSNPKELDKLMNKQQYEAYLKTVEH